MLNNAEMKADEYSPEISSQLCLLSGVEEKSAAAIKVRVQPHERIAEVASVAQVSSSQD